MAKKTVRTQEEILSDNLKYNALPPLEKRVATAKEILLQISAGTFIVGDGFGMVTIPGVFEFPRSGCFPEGNLQEHIQQKGFQCEGCAKAAVIVAKANLGNDIFLSKNSSNAGLAHRISTEIFGERCADLIEALYETYSAELLLGISNYFIPYAEEREVVLAYMRILPSRHSQAKERLVAIYQNIIDNNGHLVIGDYKY